MDDDRQHSPADPDVHLEISMASVETRPQHVLEFAVRNDHLAEIIASCRTLP